MDCGADPPVEMDYKTGPLVGMDCEPDHLNLVEEEDHFEKDYMVGLALIDKCLNLA